MPKSTSVKSIKKILSFTIFSLILLFLIGFVNFEHDSLGIPEPIFPITDNFEIIFETIFWSVVGLFMLELMIAYNETKNLKKFVRRYWLEILLLGLMFLFGGFEALKISFSIFDQIKISKTIFKLLKISFALADQIKFSNLCIRGITKPN